MRGPDRRTEGLFSYVSCERRVPEGHPLRAILSIADAALAELSPDFQELYALNGPPSIGPEKLLRALLLQAFYSVRFERQLMEQLENRHGLLVDGRVSEATGTAEREQAGTMLAGMPGRVDKNFDTAGFVAALRMLKITDVAQNTSNRRSAIDRRTTRHPGYTVSQRIRKRIEEALAGPRRSPCNSVRGTVAGTASAGSSCWRLPPTI